MKGEPRRRSPCFGRVILGALTAKRDDLRPPRFHPDDVVRIVGTTGTETDSQGEPIDARPWIGHEAVVEDAQPTADQREWLISVRVELASEEELAHVTHVWFVENSLESTGFVQDWDEEGTSWRRPFDPAKEPGWRDQIELTLVPDLTKEEAERESMRDWPHEDPDERTGAIKTGWDALAALAERVEAEEPPEIEFDYWLVDPDDEAETFGFYLCVYPTGDCWAAFERLVSEPSQDWEHDLGNADYSSTTFFYSRWRRPASGQAVFLAPGIKEAELTCRYWSQPERPWLRHAPPAR